MPSLISIVASVAMKASPVLLAVAGEELLLLLVLINISTAKAAPAVPAVRGCLQTPTQCGFPALRVLWFGLGSRAAAFPSGGLCMPQQPFLGMILSKLSAERSKRITSQPLTSQVSLMGMHPDVFINVSSS